MGDRTNNPRRVRRAICSPYAQVIKNSEIGCVEMTFRGSWRHRFAIFFVITRDESLQTMVLSYAQVLRLRLYIVCAQPSCQSVDEGVTATSTKLLYKWAEI